MGLVATTRGGFRGVATAVFLAALAAPACGPPVAPEVAPAAVRNVVWIIVDDLGWRDIGAAGSTFAGCNGSGNIFFAAGCKLGEVRAPYRVMPGRTILNRLSGNLSKAAELAQ